MFFDDEEKRRRQMQGRVDNTPNPMQATPRPMEEMTTREALEAAWNKQNPYGGEVKMTGPLGDFSYYDENLNKPKENIPSQPANQLENTSSQGWMDNLTTAVRWLPEYKTLESAKQEMDRMNKNGYDNYAHRLGMCRVGQLTNPAWPYSPAIGMGLGILKEGKDLIDKSYNGNMPLKEAFSDSLKDMKNNFEGLSYGVNNPNGDCRKWLDDLDYRRNKWRR